MRVYEQLIKVIVVISALLVHQSAWCGDWRVTPIRIVFDNTVKTGVLTINNDADERLTLQMQAMEWTQDAAGKDLFTETADIIFFPKIMTVEKKEEKILRAGIKPMKLDREKTYRLFLREIPEPKKATGTTIAIAVQFGVPIFVKPAKPEDKGDIRNLALKKGALSLNIVNEGTQHFNIASLSVKGKDAQGKETFSTETNGWYVLAGAARDYTINLPQEGCNSSAELTIDVKTDTFVLTRTLNVQKGMCSQ